MDLSGWERWELQEKCRESMLYAGGSKPELEERLVEALLPGSPLSVWFPALSEWREGFVSCVYYEDIFAVTYYDNDEMSLHKLRETQISIEHPAEEEAEEEESDDDNAARDQGAVLVAWEHIANWSKKELQAYCLERDLPTQGTKEELKLRVAHAIVDEHAASEAAESDVEEVDLSSFSRKELQEMLREGGLFAGGSRDELEQRLHEAMAEELEWEDAEANDAEASDVEDLAANMANLNTHDRPAYASPQGAAGLGMGRKRALIVGCSYRNTRQNELPGSLNDAYAIKGLLVNHFRFPEDCIMLLTDDHEDRFRRPTRRNILKGFEWLMRDLHTGDSLFFYFSGHGGSVPDPTGEEPSGYNQTICPCDCDYEEAITDSLIHKMLVKQLPMNVTLHALLDSCHSGTVMNLPWNAVLKNGRLEGWNEEYPGESWKRTTAGGLAMQFSASRHDQSAYESQRTTRSKTSSVGAATYAFTKAIEHHKGIWGFDIVYGELLGAMHDELLADKRFKGQEPTLSASSSFDIMSHRTKLRL